MKPIYLDHASATPTHPEVLKAMLPYFSQIYANPSSLHHAGMLAKQALKNSRNKVAKILKCKADEIMFTSGATESINLAISGLAFHKKRGHIITSKIEHPAVLESCKFLETQGFTITYLNVDKFGIVNSNDVKKAIKKNTILITIMSANNEVGTIQPIEKISKIAKKNKIIFHTDACQILPNNLKNIDLLTLNGSKIYGPKGVGILYKKSTIQLQPLLHGGGQEFGLRSGTENVPAIVGFAKALQLYNLKKVKETKKISSLRNYLTKKLLSIENTKLLGHSIKRLPNNVNISFKNVEAETLMKYLNLEGIYISTGSACSSNQIKISHVLQSIGEKQGSIRFSLGINTTKKELDYVFKKVKTIVESLRKI